MASLVCFPGSSALAGSLINPTRQTYWLIPLQAPGPAIPTWDVSDGVARYTFTGNGQGGTSFDCTVTDPYGAGTANVTIPGAGPNEPWSVIVSVNWSAVGETWVKYHEGEANANPGAATYGAGGNGFSVLQTDLTVTYTASGCATCDLCFEVSDTCTAAGLGGVTITIAPSGSGTTDGAGEYCANGLYSGTYDWTATKTGYLDESGSYVCACAGDSDVVSLSLDRVGGCPPPPRPPDDPPGIAQWRAEIARRWRYWFLDGPVRTSEPFRRTDGDCEEQGGVSVSASGECADTGGISTDADGECDETGGISTDADGDCDETGGVTST
jgi:hypothetical protein